MKRFTLLCAAALTLAQAPIVLAGTSTKAAATEEHLAPEVALDELQQIVTSKNATIIDVNSTDSFKQGHIPGAIHYGSNEGKLASVLPKDKNTLIVAYCGGPMCTAWEAAAKEAKKLGYTNIKHFKGGIKGWKEAKKPTETT